MVCPWFAHGDLRICGRGGCSHPVHGLVRAAPQPALGLGRGLVELGAVCGATQGSGQDGLLPVPVGAVLRKRPGAPVVSIRVAMQSRKFVLPHTWGTETGKATNMQPALYLISVQVGISGAAEMDLFWFLCLHFLQASSKLKYSF